MLSRRKLHIGCYFAGYWIESSVKGIYHIGATIDRVRREACIPRECDTRKTRRKVLQQQTLIVSCVSAGNFLITNMLLCEISPLPSYNRNLLRKERGEIRLEWVYERDFLCFSERKELSIGILLETSLQSHIRPYNSNWNRATESSP